MPNFELIISVEKLLKSYGKTVVKNVFSFPQNFSEFFLRSRNAWKSQSYSQIFLGLPQPEFTVDSCQLSSYKQENFHNFHNAYYDDYYLYNKKGHK